MDQKRRAMVDQLERELEERYVKSQISIALPIEVGLKLEAVEKILGEKFGKRIYPTDVLSGILVEFINDLYDYYVSGASAPPPPPQESDE